MMTLYRILVSSLSVTIAFVFLFPQQARAEKPRVIISTDIGGGDPDDHQSMVHYLVYADRFDTTFRGMYMGGEQGGDLGNRTFPEKHIRHHGALGDLFMRKKADIKMGDSPSVLYLLNGDPDQPEAPHWGGAFIRPEPSKRPTYWRDNPKAELMFNDKAGAKTVSQWRKDYLRDWQKRMNRAKKSSSITSVNPEEVEAPNFR